MECVKETEASSSGGPKARFTHVFFYKGKMEEDFFDPNGSSILGPHGKTEEEENPPMVKRYHGIWTLSGLNLDTLKGYRDGNCFPEILSTRSTNLDYQGHQTLSF